MVAVLTQASALLKISAPNSRARIIPSTTINSNVNHFLLSIENQTVSAIDKTLSKILSCLNYLLKVEVSKVFCISAALVIGPTPPGTGVI